MDQTQENVLEDIRWAVGRVFAIESITYPTRPEGPIVFRGRLLLEPAEAYEKLSEHLRHLGWTPLFREDGDGQKVLVYRGVIRESQPNRLLSTILFVATALSVLFVGVFSGEHPSLVSGILFAVALLGSLLAHEMGHYLMARRFGSQVSLPYFIPMPLSPFGTMGAIIRMKSPPPNRRALMLVGAAGPIAGLAIALPALVVGLLLSSVQPLPTEGPYLMEGNSLLYALIKLAVFGRFLPSNGVDVFLHPLAFAGWAALMVTGLNLIPAGQLDGGHIAYAVLGKKARILTIAVIVALVLMGFLWNGWFLWALLIALLGRHHASPLDEITPLEPRHYVLALGMLLVFVAIFTPKPLVVIVP